MVEFSLKGYALLCAIEYGLVRENADSSGYNIVPFLKFWDDFSAMLPKEIRERPDELENTINMMIE